MRGRGRPELSLARMVTFLRALTGWRRLAAACLLGAVSVLAMPPVSWWLVLFVTFPGLVLLLDEAARAMPSPWRRARAGALIGWWFGFGYMVPGLYWIGGAFLVQADKFAILMPFAITLLPAYLAAYYGLATGAAMLVWQLDAGRILALAVTMATGEWLRGHWFTGFPWNAIGYGLTINDALAQSASLIGIAGLNFWAVLIFASPVALLSLRIRRVESIAVLGLAAGLLVAALAFGQWRLAQPLPADDPAVRLRLVQPNIPETEKFEAGSQRRIFDRMLDLSRQDKEGRVDDLVGTNVVIWPEEPLNFLLLDSPEALSEIATALGGHAMLLTGAIRAETIGTPPRRRFFNSLAAIDPAGRQVAIYDKIHLVPFGEYLPYEFILSAFGLENLTRTAGGMEEGANSRRLDVPGLPSLSPLICYEAIFPGAAVEPGTRPKWLLNVTNDAWFGEQAGPYQHFHQARIRAIEEGLPLLRVAITGISAVVDAHGQVRNSLPLLTAGIIDTTLPSALQATPYARMGDLIMFLQLLVAVLAIAVLRLAQRLLSR
jgi:apolipoprotein N-acyltransferase